MPPAHARQHLSSTATFAPYAAGFTSLQRERGCSFRTLPPPEAARVALQAFTPIVTMAALFIAALEVPSARLISAVTLIAIGTAIASYGEVNLSVLGVTFMFMSESFEATRLVMTQVLLVGLKFHPSAFSPPHGAELSCADVTIRCVVGAAA